MSDIKMIKDGNTILEWDESRAVRRAEEVQAIIDNIIDGAKKSIIAAEVAKVSNVKDTA